MTVKVRTFALANGGTAVGEIISDGPLQGKRAFVSGAAPGEIAQCEITKEEDRFVQARLSSIEQASPHRIAPPCPYFGACGGCNLQHLNIAGQRAAKLEMIATMLRLQGGVIPENGVRNCSDRLPEFHYRRRVLLHLTPDGRMGFFRSGSRDVVDIENCLLASADINARIKEIREGSVNFGAENSGMVLEETAAGVKMKLLRRGAEKTMEAGDADEPVGHFSQVNAAGNAVLIDTVLNWVTPGPVTDLYAGAGNFSLPLAQKGCDVHAVELDRALVAEGQRLSQSQQLSVRFTQSSCEKFVRREKLAATVVLDPPRAGAKDVVKYFTPKTTHRIVYVSCSLPTLTRDLKTLQELKFKVKEVRFVDMFPQTHHVETVTLLETS